MTRLRFFHLLNSFIGVGIGLYCLFFAQDAANFLGIVFSTPSGLTDFRATYGGVTLACGMFFGLALFRVVDDKAGLWFSVLFYAGLGFTRLAGITLDGPQNPIMFRFLQLEVVFLLVSIYFLKKCLKYPSELPC